MWIVPVCFRIIINKTGHMIWENSVRKAEKLSFKCTAKRTFRAKREGVQRRIRIHSSISQRSFLFNFVLVCVRQGGHPLLHRHGGLAALLDVGHHHNQIAAQLSPAHDLPRPPRPAHHLPRPPRHPPRHVLRPAPLHVAVQVSESAGGGSPLLGVQRRSVTLHWELVWRCRTTERDCTTLGCTLRCTRLYWPHHSNIYRSCRVSFHHGRSNNNFKLVSPITVSKCSTQ